jgi:hypothetical protein
MRMRWSMGALAGLLLLGAGAGGPVEAAGLRAMPAAPMAVMRAPAATARQPAGGPVCGASPARVRPWATLWRDTAAVLGMTAAAFRSDRARGETVAALAAERHMTRAAVDRALTADLRAAVKAAVARGGMTAAEGQRMTGGLAVWTKAWVAGTAGPAWHGGYGRERLLRGVAQTLDLAPTTLVADLRAGRTLAAVAAAQGSSAARVEAVLAREMTSRLHAAVQAGRLPAAVAGRLEARLRVGIARWVTGRPPIGTWSGRPCSSGMRGAAARGTGV